MKVNTKKLRKYLNWFERNVPDSRFYFGDYRLGIDTASRMSKDIELRCKPNTCGTVGCIIGHIDEYLKIDKHIIDVVSSAYETYSEYAEKEFEMDVKAFEIFIPHRDCEYIKHPLVPMCGSIATKSAVLRMVRTFCDKIDSGEIPLDPHYVPGGN